MAIELRSAKCDTHIHTDNQHCAGKQQQQKRNIMQNLKRLTDSIECRIIKKHELKHVLDFQYKSNDACTLTFGFSKFFPDNEKQRALFMYVNIRRRLTNQPTNQPYCNKSHSCNKSVEFFWYICAHMEKCSIYLVFFFHSEYDRMTRSKQRHRLYEFNCLHSKTEWTNPWNAVHKMQSY